MWENTGKTFDDIIRERQQDTRPAPYSLYSADLGRGGRVRQRMNRELEGATLVGWVASLQLKKGWGVIESESLPEFEVGFTLDDFVGRGDVQVGDCVKFELAYGGFGTGDPQAVSVRLVSEPATREIAKPVSSATEHFYIGDEGTSARRPSRKESSSVYGPVPRKSSRNTGAPPAGTREGRRVRVLNFPWTMTRDDIRENFQSVGPVLDVTFDERRVGQAVVTFQDAVSAKVAVDDYDKGTLNGREILVRYEK